MNREEVRHQIGVASEVMHLLHDFSWRERLSLPKCRPGQLQRINGCITRVACGIRKLQLQLEDGVFDPVTKFEPLPHRMAVKIRQVGCMVINGGEIDEEFGAGIVAKNATKVVWTKTGRRITISAAGVKADIPRLPKCITAAISMAGLDVGIPRFVVRQSKDADPLYLERKLAGVAVNQSLGDSLGSADPDVPACAPLNIVIADDHPIFRDGLRRLLEAEPNLKVVGEASDGAEAVKIVRQLKPDILLLDLAMPKHPGLEALRDLRAGVSSTPVRVILLTPDVGKNQIVEALQVGARGVVLRDSPAQLLLKAIHTVMSGEYWVGRESVSNMMQYLRTLVQSSSGEARQKNFGLTPRELEVVSAVVAGYSTKEIAQYFKISEHTVTHHLGNIFNKLGVSTHVELALFAVNQSLPLRLFEVSQSLPVRQCRPRDEPRRQNTYPSIDADFEHRDFGEPLLGVFLILLPWVVDVARNSVES